MKTKNGKNLKVKVLVDSGCTYTGIDEQLVKEKRIQTRPINFSFKVFNTDGTKHRGYQGGISGDRNQWTQGTTGSCGNGFEWNGHVFRSQLVGQAQPRSQLEKWYNKVHKMSRKL